MTGEESKPKNGRWRLLRDIVFVGLGTWMLIHETLSDNPQPLILGAALVLLQLPPVLRATDFLTKK